MAASGPSLRGKVALVTGSTTGIGKAIMTRLAQFGCDVAMHGRLDEAEMSAMREGVLEEVPEGVKVITSCADLQQPQQIRDMVAKVQNELGRLDILVNNAGVQYVAPVKDYPEEQWRRIQDVCLDAPFHSCKAALPFMLDQGWGRLVNICSFHGTVASPFKAAYCAAKHGVYGFTKSLALEVATTGVTVNCVSPGYTYTQLIAKQLEDSARTRGISPEQVVQEVMLANQPIKRFVEPSEIAALVHFLCGDEAGAITGANLSADGGWTAQ